LGADPVLASPQPRILAGVCSITLGKEKALLAEQVADSRADNADLGRLDWPAGGHLRYG
jgi:hypothetical protein